MSSPRRYAPAAGPGVASSSSTCCFPSPATDSRGTRPYSARAGFVVPKAVGGAVQRNGVKRRLRHLVRDRLEQFPAGTDLVVRALPGAADRSYQGLSADLDAALAAAGRRRPVPR